MEFVKRTLLLLLFAESILCFNILVVFPEPTKSHGFLGAGYVTHLLQAGHNVTYITPFPLKDIPGQLTQINVSSNLNISTVIMSDLEQTHTSESSFLLMLGHSFARLSVRHMEVQRLLRNPANKFDVVVAEWIDSEIYSGFSAVYGCPLVWSISTQMHWQPLRLMDEYPNPAYSADVNSGYTPPFNFGQRMKELWIQIEKSWILFFTISQLEVEVYNDVFRTAAESKGGTIAPYEELHKSYSMMLVNNHPTIGAAWRLPPNVRDIGGYHVKDPPEALSKELQLIMDNADGVIYFSFGSTSSGKDMSKRMKSELLDVFRKLNEVVIWKMEEQLENVSDNVILLEWAPQTSLLAHPNMKVFVTHGGQLSVTEAIHFGVPVIAIPLHVDQFVNTDALAKKGVAIKLDYNDELPSNLEKAFFHIFKNSSYREAMQNLSKAYHDRLVSPGAELVHWVEHVVRTGGAAHLRSPALMVPWYQKMYLELVAIIICLIVLFVFLCKCVWWCCKKMNLCYC